MEISNETYKSLEEKNNLCRVCLSASDENKCIFTTQLTVDCENYGFQGLYEKLQLYGGIELAQDDGLPDKLCDECISLMLIAHDFRTQCQDTDKKLRARLENMKTESDDNPKICMEIALENKVKHELKTMVPCNEDELLNDETTMCEGIPKKECPLENPSRDIADTKNSTHVQSIENQNNVVPRQTRRLMMFKRATSMESLKSRREQQRRHIKKVVMTKRNDGKIGKNESSHKCTKCCRHFDSKESLKEHNLNHDCSKYSCDQCDERFIRLADFVEHAKSHIYSEKLVPATCKICNKHFRKVLTMLRHLNVHKRENPSAVLEILKEIRETRLGKSMNEEKGEIENIEMRKKFLKDRGSLDRGDMSVNDLDDEKSLRNKDSKTALLKEKEESMKLINRWLREELDTDIEGKGFPCNYCEKSYVTKKSLIKHIGNYHVRTKCENCGDNCDCRVEDMARDGTRQSGGKIKNTCNECEKKFETKSRLERHAKIHARDRDNREKNFKRFLCHICSKTFRQNTGLVFHMRTHTGHKPHVCRYCGRGFTSNSNRTNHERTHTGDRPFVCQYCSAAFAKSCTLKAHITTHTGEANYHCKTCDKSFRRLKYLKEHRFTHTGEKPYVCKLCGTAYSHSGSLFVHEKKCKAQLGHDDRTDNSRDDSTTMSIENSVNSTILNIVDIPVTSIANTNFFDARDDAQAHRSNVHLEDSNFLITGI